jgi:EEF1A lysine methyltransferase 3
MQTSWNLPDDSKNKYKTHFTDITVRDKKLQFLEIENLEVIIEKIISPSAASAAERPFWAKIWESSIFLAHFLGGLPINAGQKMLEIGAAMGVAGIFAAIFGHNVTITDLNEEALAFARVNAAVNGLRHLTIRKLDWTDPADNEVYDVIFGSDILYDRCTYNSLVTFLRTHIREDGNIYLAISGFVRAVPFFKEAFNYFEIERKTHTLRSEDESFRIYLYTLKPLKREPSP